LQCSPAKTRHALNSQASIAAAKNLVLMSAKWFEKRFEETHCKLQVERIAGCSQRNKGGKRGGELLDSMRASRVVCDSWTNHAKKEGVLLGAPPFVFKGGDFVLLLWPSAAPSVAQKVSSALASRRLYLFTCWLAPGS
jgi:hypothetical protein